MQKENKDIADQNFLLSKDILSEVTSLKIQDEEDFKFVTATLKRVKNLYNALVSKKEKATLPLKQAAKEIDSWWKPALDSLRSSEKELKNILISYKFLEEEKRLKSMNTICKEAEKGDFDSAHLAAKELKKPLEDVGISIRKTWDFKVENIQLVPRSYLQIRQNSIKEHIRQAAKTGNDPDKIPGISFFPSGSVSARVK